MGKKRKKYSKEFKVSVVRELESGVSPGELSRKHEIHPSLPKRCLRFTINITVTVTVTMPDNRNNNKDNKRTIIKSQIIKPC